MATEAFTIAKRPGLDVDGETQWVPPRQTRRPSARAKSEVRAKVAHTSSQKRRIEIFVTEPVCVALGWVSGGVVAAAFRSSPDSTQVRLQPSHIGVRAVAVGRTSKTVRVVIAGAPLRPAICAGTRSVSYRMDGTALIADLPKEWFQ